MCQRFKNAGSSKGFRHTDEWKKQHSKRLRGRKLSETIINKIKKSHQNLTIFKRNLLLGKCGEQSRNWKLKDDERAEIFQKYKLGISQRKLAHLYNVSQKTISRVVCKLEKERKNEKQ